MEDSAAAAAALPAGWKLKEKSASVVSAPASSCGSRMGLEEPAVASAGAPTLDSMRQGKAAITDTDTWFADKLVGLSAGRDQRKVQLTDGYQGWALLDPLVVEVEDTATEDSTGLALCKSSDGEDVRVSIRLNKPPSTSYFQMHTGADVHDKPTVVAACGNLFLIHMVVAVTDPPPTSYYDNFFVYKAHPSMGWLRLDNDSLGHGLALVESKGKESLQLDFTEKDSNETTILFHQSFSREDMNDVTIKLRCPACQPGLLKWYNGIPGLIEHAQAEQLEMVNAHSACAKLLGMMRSDAINSMAH